MISAAAAVNPGFARYAGGSGPIASLFERTGGHSPAPAAQVPDLSDLGFAALRRALQEHLSIPLPATPLASSVAAGEPPGPRTVADTVLGFVADRLQREAESGASSERLSGLLRQARSGFETGLGQARDELAALGLLDTRMEAGIEETRRLVHDGLDRFAGRLLGDSGERATAGGISSLSGSRSYASSETESMSLEVRTRDGDTVRLQLRASSASGSHVQFGYASDGTQARFAYSASEFSLYSSRFELNVDGELDADERAALEDLLSQVERLADDFFDGDSQAALQGALRLGYDREEIAGFSLHLTETRVQQLTETYRQVQDYAGATDARPSTTEPVAGLRNLGQFLKTMREAVDAARAFADGEGLLRELFEAARRLDPRDLAAGDDETLRGRQELLNLLQARLGAPDEPEEATPEPLADAA